MALSRSSNFRPELPIALTRSALLSVLFAAIAALPLSTVFADYAISGTTSGNGHNGVTFYAYTDIDYNSTSSSWNAYHTGGYMKVTNSLDARCDRNRLFSSGWTQIANKNWAGTPFPFYAGPWYYDYFTYAYPAANFTLRNWWQVDDAFSGGTCSYGGGAGLYRNTQTGTVYTETVPSP